MEAGHDGRLTAPIALSAFFCSVPGLVRRCLVMTLFYYATVRPLTVSHRLIQGPSSSIFVGHKRKEFVVHKALLCHLSPYFRGALNSDFIEAQNNAVELKDEDPACFQYIVAWMYRGTLGQFKYDGGSSREEAISLCTQTCRLYYLADFLCIEGLLVQLLSYLHDLFDRFRDKKIVPLNSDVIIHLYENTTEASELRATVMHELVRVWCDHSREVDIKDFEVCIDRVQGVATILLTGMRNWQEKRTRTARENLTAGFSLAPSTVDILNRWPSNIAQRVLNPVVGAPISRPAVAPPLPRPAAAALASGPAPLASYPAVNPQAPAPAAANPPPWNRRPFPPAAAFPTGRVCGRCGVDICDPVPSDGPAGPGDRCNICRFMGEMRRPRRQRT